MSPRAIPTGISSCLLHAERFVCLLPGSHPLADKPKIEVPWLRDEDFVLFPRHFSPEYYDKIVGVCARAGFTPNIRHQVRHMLTIATLVSKNFGVSLVPQSIEVAGLPNLVCRPLSRERKMSELRGIWRDDEHSPAVLSMMKALGVTARA